MRYVTYNPESGQLLGAFIQDLLAQDADNFIEVSDDDVYQNWTSYRANPARDGLELAPIVAPAQKVPEEVRADQIALAAVDAAIWAGVKNYFASLPNNDAGERKRIRFARRPTVRRDCDLVAEVAAALALSSSDLDALFISAAATA